MSKKPVVLMILDGYGLNDNCEHNAVCEGKTPVMDQLMSQCPFVKGQASGLAVGLPEGQMGNSEVGHLNMGAGRVVYQELTRITKSINDGDFFNVPEFLTAVENCKKNNSALHLFGLVSTGGVHSHLNHIYGLLELAKIPYVGCGVLASAVSMDKLYTKIIVDTLGIRQAKYVPVMRWEMEKDMDIAVAAVETHFQYPVFVKPSNAGSSRGVNKAETRKELIGALKEAAKHDRKILVEETIVGHEVECAVLGGGQNPVKASGVGEILAAAEFYDFDAKYNNAESRTVIGPELPGDSAERVREAAAKIFNAVDGYGLSRVDFFVTSDGEVIFNEINTMPGFTAISMYPMLWEAAGISKPELVDRLIDLAFER